MNIDIQHDLDLQPADLVGQRVVVLGTSGSGKSNTAAVLLEELMPIFPFTVVDPDGEYWGLREQYQMLLVGNMQRADVPADPANAEAIAELSFDQNVSVILDFSESRSDEMMRFLVAYFDKLWEITSPEAARKPYGILIEEARMFAPQSKPTPVKPLLIDIATRGRKRGLTSILVSQRATGVDKDLLTQAKHFFLHQSAFPTDTEVYLDIVPRPRAEVQSMVERLEVGQPIYRHERTVTVVTMRLRHTFHAGSTPTLDGGAPQQKSVDAKLLQRLKQSLTGNPDADRSSVEDENSQHTQRLQRRIDDLQHQLEARELVYNAHNEQMNALAEQLILIAGQLTNTVGQDQLDDPTDFPSAIPNQPEAEAEPETSTPIGLRKGERFILSMLARRYPTRLTRTQVATLAGYTASGGTFGAYLSTLKRGRLVVERGGEITITQAGFEYLDFDEPLQPQTTEEVLSLWRKVLRAGERKLLDELVQIYPNTLSRDELANRTGYTASAGTFGTYLGTLRRNNLLLVEGNRVSASPDLFIGSLSPAQESEPS